MLTCVPPCPFFCHSQESAEENSTRHCHCSCRLAGVQGRDRTYLITVISSDGFIDRLSKNQCSVGLLSPTSCLPQVLASKTADHKL